MTFPPPTVPAAVDATTPAKKQPRAKLEVLAVALALLLGGVGLVWYLNEQDANAVGSSNRPRVGFDHGQRGAPS